MINEAKTQLNNHSNVTLKQGFANDLTSLIPSKADLIISGKLS